MDIDVLQLVYRLWQGAAEFFSNSFFIAAIKFFLFVYIVVLLVDVVILLIIRGLSEDLKKTLFGADRPLLTRSTIIKRWEKILTRLEGDNPSQYKVAVLEADAFADEILSGIGYKGTTMTDRLASIHEGQLESKNIISEAHQIRNRIVHEADLAISLEDAKKCLDAYHAFFEEVELF
ncbi:MAG TPA: hypothetical protein VJH89_04050 [Patescibacteria group bacterium]|nr:hypothetical protein [Patescibacteria group bacterium]